MLPVSWKVSKATDFSSKICEEIALKLPLSFIKELYKTSLPHRMNSTNNKYF